MHKHKTSGAAPGIALCLLLAGCAARPEPAATWYASSMVGKRDNHTNPKGFRHEGTAFLAWLAENGLTSPAFYTINGDRHWQYHSVHPSGIEEFSSGAFVSQNAREGRPPGDPGSTDPEGRIDQPYIQRVPVGGMLHVQVDPSSAVERPSIVFTFLDERGGVLYAVRRYASGPAGGTTGNEP